MSNPYATLQKCSNMYRNSVNHGQQIALPDWILATFDDACVLGVCELPWKSRIGRNIVRLWGKAQATGYRSRAWLCLSRNTIHCREPRAESHTDQRLNPGRPRGWDGWVAMMALVKHHLLRIGQPMHSCYNYDAEINAIWDQETRGVSRGGWRQSLPLSNE